MGATFQRARRPEQKEERRLKLLQTAREELQSGASLDDLGLNELARLTRMAKSNVYRYFESREALLLELLWEEWSLWFGDLEKQILSKKIPPNDPEALVRRMATSLAGRNLLCVLTSALPTVLEANLSEERVRSFKKSSLDFFSHVAACFHATAPQLSAEQYAELLHDAACLISGLYPHGHPVKIVQKVLKSPDLKFFKRDFKQDMERMLVAIAFSDRIKSGS